MKSIAAMLISFVASGALNAGEMSRPLVELLFSNDTRNTGTLGGEGRLEEWAPDEGAKFGPGLRGMGLDLTASSRGGGSERTKAGGSVKLQGMGIESFQQMTLTVWFKPEGANAPARLLYYGPSWDLYVGNEIVGFKTRHDRKDQPHDTPSHEPLVVDGQWNFVAVTFDDRAGESRCYHGLKGGRLRHVCTWQDVPKLDRGSADLEIGNLSGIRPFKGCIDSVRIFDRVLTADQIEQVFAMDGRPKLSLKQRTRRMPARPALFDYGDVCLSSRSIRPKSIETIKAFRANRLMWAYSTNGDFIRDHADLLDDHVNPAVVGVVVDLDHFDRGRVARLCRRLFEAQTPFAFVPVGHSYYECGLDAERLTAYELLLIAADEDAMAEKDLTALRTAAAETPVVPDRDASAELLAGESPFEVWGPKGIYVLPRVKPDADDHTLVCHVLNRVDRDGAQELKWVSFLVKRWAFLGNKLASVRWHVPGQEAVNIEFERLADGARIIIPRLPIWGIAELRFE